MRDSKKGFPAAVRNRPNHDPPRCLPKAPSQHTQYQHQPQPDNDWNHPLFDQYHSIKVQASPHGSDQQPNIPSDQVSGHGNFGSLDDDPAAAMRYTECRLQSVAEDALLADLGRATVDWVPTFDASQVGQYRWMSIDGDGSGR